MRPGLLSVHQRALLAYRPLGVIGVIGPWNYPLYTPMGSIGYALAAGNAVVFKPSELTPGVGVLLARSFGEAVPDHADLLLTVTGPGSTGAALVSADGPAGVDKVAFTGSPGTARKVAAACAATLTPLLAECGGKDAVLVVADADLDAAADAIVWGAMGNSRPDLQPAWSGYTRTPRCTRPCAHASSAGRGRWCPATPTGRSPCRPSSAWWNAM